MITPPTIFTLKITQRLLFSCMKQLRIFLLLALWTGTIGLTGTLYGQSEIAEIMRNRSIDWQQPQARAQAVEEMRAIEVRELNKARQIAQQRGKPLREKLPNGKVRELVGLDEDGDLLYVETKNVNAAISTGANLLHQAPYSLDGFGLRVGVWDAPDSARVTHQEFNEGAASRVTAMNGSTTPDNHATHVAGTIAAYGVAGNAKGMAFQARIDSYDWTSDTTEMTSAGATAAGQHDTKIYLSNHSYGYSYGWRNDGGWIWTGTGTDQNAYDPDFGKYSSKAAQLDGVAYNTPYYLFFWAAGNENNDGPNNGNTVTIGGQSVTYNSSIHPQNDGDYRNGFETIGDHGVSKNLITVGAANDAVTSGQRDPSKATIASFSSTGPVDDGRIKPDLVANGVGLYSPGASGDGTYLNYSGTSMASPNATGSAALLVDFYRNLFGSTAAMRSSTLKALLIHTATDIGNPGPDYTYGWGLVDVKTAADLLQRQADFSELESIVEAQVTTALPVRSYTFAWDGESPIRATLAWTDPSGISQSAHDDRSPDLVNDLNLKLIAPDGTEYFPFVMPFVGTWTVASMSQHATTGVNHVDNVEQVLVSTPGQNGAWTAEVTYLGSLTNNVQDYGLIISGAGTAGALVFNPVAYSIDENGGPATITVERVGGTTGAVSVDYSTADGTAIASSDYTAVSGTLNWADGEGGSKSINVPIINDAASETYEETLSVNLSNAIGTTISGSGSATLTIRDDEPLMAITAPNGGEQLNTSSLYTITWISSVGGNVRIELLKNGINYTTIAASTPNDGSFGWTVPILAPTGSDYRIRIASLSGSESDESNGTFAINNQQTSVDIYTANMDANPAWTLQGAWAYGVPKGLGGDPSSGNTGVNVIGFNLDGAYTNNLPQTHATTAAIDCMGYTGVELSFYRWLGVENSIYDSASIQVSNNGTTWTTVWAHTGGSFTDASWQYLTYDISTVADQEPTVYIRWTMGATDSSVTFCGWNIDDVVVRGLGSAENPAGELTFNGASLTANESDGSAVITVDRIGGSTGAVSVDYATSDGTALAGVDYTATTGSLNWADGDGSSKTISVPIINDSEHEDFFETITLTLTNTVGATIADGNPATLNIQDDDNNTPSVAAGDDQFAEWREQTDVPGLYYGTVPGNIDVITPNPQSQILVDVSSETENAIAANTTEIYTGSIYDADGQISFTENIDDKARIWIDDVLVLSDDAWSARTSTANLNLVPGWHSIEIRISNGTGGSGPGSGIGIGYDPAGGTNWQTLVDPGDGSLLKVSQQSSGADVNLVGSASDLDGDPLTTTWSFVSGPGSVTFGDSSAPVTTANFDAQGVYTLRLTADDGREQNSDDIFITVGIPGLELTIDQAAISENGGSTNASVSRLFTVGELVVQLASDDSSEATVPASVTILDGQASANFTITAQDDVLVDGDQTVTITATSPGNPDASGTIAITDDEVAILTLEVAAAAVGESDGLGATTATVTRNSVTSSEMVVTLSSSDTSEVNVPATVTIPAGQATSPPFAIDAIDDAIVDGTQTVTITALYAGHTNGTDTLDVTDDTPLLLTVVAGSGGVSTTGSGLKDPDGSPFAVSATASTGYDFANWTVTAGLAAFDDANAASTFVSASADATVQANFALATYIINYDGNGNDGGTAPADQAKTHGQDLTLSDPGNLVKTGYSFSAWNTAVDGSGTAYAANGTYTIDAAVTLYAQWTPNSYTVSFDANGGTAPAPASKIVTFDATYGTLATTERSGYAFTGWFTQASGGTQVDASTNVSTAADHTLYAQWVNSLTWDANGTAAGQTDGGGSWLTADQWWNGSANQNWFDGSNVQFGHGGNGGTVTVGTIAAGSVLMDNFSGTYTLANGTLTQSGGFTLGANAGQVTMGSGMTLTGDGGLAVNGGFLKTNGATLSYLGNTSVTGGGILLSQNNLPAGNVTLNHGAISDYYRATTQFASGLGNGPGQIQIFGDSGFGGGNGNSSFRIGAQNSVLTWGSTYFNPNSLRLRTAVDNNGPSIYGQVTLQNRIDLNGGSRTIDVFRSGADAMQSWGKIDAGIQDSGGTGSLIKTGGGTLVLGGSTSTWGGSTTISEGVIDFAATNIANIGGGSGRNISMAGGTALRFNALSNAVISRIVETTDEITLMTSNTGNDLDFSSTGANLPGAFLANWASNGAKVEYSGSLIPGGNTYRLGAPYAKGVLGIVSILSDGGSPNSLLINERGAGAVILTAANTFSDTTVIRSGGRLILGDNLAVQNSIVDTSNGTLYLSTGAAIGAVTGDTLADSPTFGGLVGNVDLSTFIGSGSAGVNNTAVLDHSSILGFTLNPGDGLSATYAGAIGEFATGTSLTKSGLGAQTLTGVNSYTGVTTVNGGKLFINGDQSAATGNISVAGGATLGGTGILGGSTTIADTGRLEFDISTDAASHDPLNIASGQDFTFSGTSVLTITTSGGAVAGTYTLITGGNIISGAVPSSVNLPFGWSGSLAISGDSLLLELTSTVPSTYSVTYDGNGNNGGSVPVDATSYNENDTVTAQGNTGNLVKTGYVFAGWNTASDGSGTSLPAGTSFAITVNVTLYAQWITVYHDWAAGFGGVLADPDPALDFDHGGVATGLEWVYGGDPSSIDDDTLIAPTIDDSNPQGLSFTFRRSAQAAADPNTIISIVYSSNLLNWTQAVADGATVFMTETENHFGTGIDRVEVFIDKDLFTGNQSFVRIQVDLLTP